MTEQSLANPLPPKANRAVVLLASVLAVLGALAGAGVAVFGLPQILWATVGFMLVSLISAGLGLLVGAGKMTAGFGMSTLCIGGCVALSTGFAWIDLRPNLGDTPQIARLLTPWVLGNVLLSVVIVASGAVAVLNRRRASWAAIGKGMAFLVPAVVVLGLGYIAINRISDGDNGRVLALAVLLIGGTIVGVLVSLGGHHLIRAFELAVDEPDSTSA